MTINKSKPTVFTGLLILALVCVSFVNLCSWVIHWCLNANFVKQASLITGIFTIGLLTVAWQIWRTSRYTKQLLSYAQVPTPPHIEVIITEFGLDKTQVVLIQSPQPIAFCFGFLRPRICLSTSLIELLSPPQLQAALLHENYHRLRFDPLRILLIEAIGTALFFLPVIQEWRTLYKIKLELDADRYAVDRVGKPALAGALHRLLSYATVPISVPSVITAGISANSARIAALLGERSAPQQISGRSLLRSTAIIWVLCLLLMI
jgi:Zn-dependent protease with chaperone function